MRRRGLSLLETLLAAALLSIILFVVATLLPGSLLNLRKGHEKLSASTLAQRILETCRTQPFDDVTSTTLQETVDGTLFKAGLAVTSINSELKRLVVTVKWDNGHAATDSIVYETRLFRFRNQ